MCAYESEQLMMMSLLLLITMHEYGSLRRKIETHTSDIYFTPLVNSR